MDISFELYEGRGGGRLRLYGDEIRMTIALDVDDLANLREAIGGTTDLSEIRSQVEALHSKLSDAESSLRSQISDAESALSEIDRAVDDADSEIREALDALESLVRE